MLRRVDRYCEQALSCFHTDAVQRRPVESDRFRISFRSEQRELTPDQDGYLLDYIQKPCY